MAHSAFAVQEDIEDLRFLRFLLFSSQGEQFGARNLAGVAGHARRSNKKTTRERKVVNV
jgi:hypothetical protein